MQAYSTQPYLCMDVSRTNAARARLHQLLPFVRLVGPAASQATGVGPVLCDREADAFVVISRLLFASKSSVLVLLPS